MGVTQAVLVNNATVKEEIDGVPGASSTLKTITHDAYNSSRTLTPTSTPKVDDGIVNEVALAAGAATIDLTSLLGSNGGTIDATGKKLQYVKVKNKAGNAAMTFVPGVTNPYNVLGAGFSVILLAGQEFTFFANNASPDVAAGAKEIDVSGTGTEVFEVTLLFGPGS